MSQLRASKIEDQQQSGLGTGKLTASVHEDGSGIDFVDDRVERRLIFGPDGASETVRRVVDQFERILVGFDLRKMNIRFASVSATTSPSARIDSKQRTFMIPTTGPNVSSLITFIE